MISEKAHVRVQASFSFMLYYQNAEDFVQLWKLVKLERFPVPSVMCIHELEDFTEWFSELKLILQANLYLHFSMCTLNNDLFRLTSGFSHCLPY